MIGNRIITYKEVLTKQELQEVHDLEATGVKNGVSYKIDPSVNGGILCSRNGILKGFMTMDCFGSDEIESAAITDSETDWEAMTDILISCANEKMAKEILFIASPEDKLVIHKLNSKGIKPLFSEYRMVFDIESFSPASINGITIRRAVQTDSNYIANLDREAFGGEVNYSNVRDLDCTYIIIKGQQPVGKLRVDEAGGIHGIYGVIVESDQRSQGIGAQALTLLLNQLIDCRARHIYLEVDSGNPAAFYLYKKLGFKVTAEFLYYPYLL